ncbi:two-component sensor histidine kinase [Bifidobacterium sp. SMB2]|uniref:Sensor-like histidine kinase SenX3 n=1 Tax=Bifidobacterium saimiriisciurei TaxID=2661627 RepID=A0ABX0C850_9BIFI|nr:MULTISPECIES: ATP-binding protein [Bifidobacterium]NEG95246.1 two-component sensor histidine kinase [Bifidobacterium sp. SMB2]NEH11323.1 two-component sensor histidine kinase [Bifidobacterium saimiriisciurei]
MAISLSTTESSFFLIVLIIVVAAAALLIWQSYRKGVDAGALRMVRKIAQDNEPPASSVFGRGVNAQNAAHNLLDVMRSAVILVDGLGNTRYVSPLAEQLDVVSDGHLEYDEIRDILAQVVSDGKIRDREIELHVEPESGRLTDRVPMYLRVRIGRIARIHSDVMPDDDVDDIAVSGGADELYAVFLENVSERRNFERMRRDFVTNVSHELKTPAGAISLLAETVSDAAEDPDAVRYFSGRISKESERLTELVQKLIALQKVQNDEGLAAADRRPVDVPKVVREALDENAVQADAANIELRMYVGDDTVGVQTNEADGAGRPGDGADGEAAAPAAPECEPMIVDGDADAIKTAVKNLVENAVHYSPRGTHVGVSVKQEGDDVRIRVIDQGIGIPVEAQSRIFERFYRVDPARSRETGGTGLGLAITKHIVQEAGGTIDVWSRPGEGSTFTITLPVASGENHSDD